MTTSAIVLDSFSLPTENVDLHVPDLFELAKVLEQGLLKDYASVQVKVLDSSPDLRQVPYFLSAPGFGRSQSTPKSPPTTIVDLGGPPYLLPLVNRSRLYSLAEITHQNLGYHGFPAFLIGAGAGPWPRIGSNCEGIYDVFLKADASVEENHTLTSSVKVATGGQVVEKAPKDNTNCALLANILVSGGEQKSPVLEITCSKRTGPNDPITSIRKALDAKYTPDKKVVGLGGVFLLETGLVKIHVMPDFSEKPIQTDQEVNDWLKFYEASAPFCSLGTLVSSDPGLDLRPQHFHGRTQDQKVAGHYHHDLTPHKVTYRAILVSAEKLVRIDRPKNTHQIGRD